MFNSLLTQQQRINQIENFISDLATKGTISMESADMLDRLIPGGIRQVDPDFMFDIDESEEGAPIAMEAAMEGLSKIKIAFVIAIIAFIVKYISGLNKNSYDFSASGGGGGGWGGSAPARFETKQSPTSQACHTACDDYIELVSTDIEHLREAFKDAVERFVDQKHLETASHKKTEVNNLLNNIIPRIIRNNGGGKTENESVGKFESFMFTKTKKPGTSQLDENNFKSFLDIEDKTTVTPAQIKQAPGILKYLANSYSVNNLFSNYFKSAKDNSGKVSKGLGIPFFLINQEAQKGAAQLAGIIVSLIDGSGNLKSALDEFETVLKNPEMRHIDINQGNGYIKPLWAWLAKNLGKETQDKTVIKDYLIRMDGVIGLGVDLSTNDNVYYNTTFRANLLKRFIKETIDGSDSADAPDEKGIFDISGMSKSAEKVITGFLVGNLADVVDYSFLDSIENLAKALENGERDIVSLTDTCKDLEASILTAISMFKHSGQLSNEESQTLIDNFKKSQETRRNQKLETYDQDADILKAQKNLPYMLNLVSGLLRMLLITLAAGAKYNIDMNKLVKARCDGVIKNLQGMAQDYYDLLKSMSKIMDENLLPKTMMENKP